MKAKKDGGEEGGGLPCFSLYLFTSTIMDLFLPPCTLLYTENPVRGKR